MNDDKIDEIIIEITERLFPLIPNSNSLDISSMIDRTTSMDILEDVRDGLVNSLGHYKNDKVRKDIVRLSNEVEGYRNEWINLTEHQKTRYVELKVFFITMDRLLTDSQNEHLVTQRDNEMEAEYHSKLQSLIDEKTNN